MTDRNDSDEDEKGKTLGDLTSVDAGRLAAVLESSRGAHGVRGEIDPENMRLARQLANNIEQAIIFNRPEQWERLRAAHEAFHGLDDGRDSRRCAVVTAIEGILAKWHDSHGGSRAHPSFEKNLASALDTYTKWLAADLVRIEPAFGEARVDRLRELLDRAYLTFASGAKGRGAIGPVGVAMKLSIECQAFGDTDERASEKAFHRAIERSQK